METVTAGYSGTPLVKKMGLKAGMMAHVENAPEGYLKYVLDALPHGLILNHAGQEELDFIHYFSKRAAELERDFPRLMRSIKKNGMVWISWPKKASKISTDLDENRIWGLGLAVGLVDVKVCAIDEQWSGLKFVIPVKDR